VGRGAAALPKSTAIAPTPLGDILPFADMLPDGVQRLYKHQTA
jgi:hypothetical protein